MLVRVRRRPIPCPARVGAPRRPVGTAGTREISGYSYSFLQRFFLAVMLSCDSAWTGHSHQPVSLFGNSCHSHPVCFRARFFGGGPSECQKAHRSARNGTEIQEFFYLKNRGLCAIGLSELLESSGKIQLIPGAPLSSVRPKKLIGEKAVHLWIEGTEVRRERSRASR